MLMFGLTGSCFGLLTFAGLLKIFHATEEEFRTGWFLVSNMTGLLIMLAVRTRRPFFRSRPDAWLIVAASGVAIVTLSLSPMGKVFELVRPSFALLGLVAMIAVFCAVAMEVGKGIFFGRQEQV